MSDIARDGVRRLQTLRDALVEAEWQKFKDREPAVQKLIAAAKGPAMACQNLRIRGHRCEDQDWDPKRNHWCGNCLLRAALKPFEDTP